MGACNELSYCLLSIFNLILMLLSGATCVMSAIGLADTELEIKGVMVRDLTDLLPRQFLIGLAASAGIVFIVSFLGCFGASKTKQMANDAEDGFDPNTTPCHSAGHLFLSLYILVLLALLVAAGALAVLVLDYSGKLDGQASEYASKGQSVVNNEVMPRINEAITKFLSTKDPKSRQAWAETQDKLKCCGMRQDHDSVPRNSTGNLGESCTTLFVPDTNSSTHTRGADAKAGAAPTMVCGHLIFEALAAKSKLVGYVGIGAVAVLFMCLIAAIELRCCSLGKVAPSSLQRKDSELNEWED